jgi:UDPglucose--hexose-1-phosphate uridylyltransferase
MSELRLNLITREWVVIAPERAKRPDTFNTKPENTLPESYDADCPFCPGHEAGSPDEIMRIPETGQWQIRVVPNKFSCLSVDTKKQSTSKGEKLNVAGYGRHEVVIESASHNLYIAHMPLHAINNLIQTYKSRFQAIYQDEDIEHVIIFKNHGEAAGTSLQHPHSQIIGTPITPMQFTDRLDAARSYFKDTGKCLMCAMLSEELTDGRRIVLDTKHFTTFIPYAALSPFHTWIFPKQHGASFADISSIEVQDMALHLKNILAKLYVGLDNPSFNFVIRSESPRAADCEYFHWYISIVPRLSRPAGFEMGTGMYINTSTPEDSAAFLRDLEL